MSNVFLQALDVCKSWTDQLWVLLRAHYQQRLSEVVREATSSSHATQIGTAPTSEDILEGVVRDPLLSIEDCLNFLAESGSEAVKAQVWGEESSTTEYDKFLTSFRVWACSLSCSRPSWRVTSGRQCAFLRLGPGQKARMAFQCAPLRFEMVLILHTSLVITLSLKNDLLVSSFCDSSHYVPQRIW